MSTKDPAVTSLQTLANELKEKVFVYLSANDLLNLILACKTFSSYIEDNKNLMEKFTVRTSKLLSSEIVSHRKYSRIFVDCDLSKDVLEVIKESFINIQQSIKVIIFDKRIEPNDNNYQHYSHGKSFIQLCPNYTTINLIDGKLEAVHKIPTKVKTFNAFRPSVLLPDLDDLEEINFFEGTQFCNQRYQAAQLSIKSLNVFKSFQSSDLFADFYTNTYHSLELPESNIREISFQACSLSMHLYLDVPHLNKLKLVNCRTDEDPFGIIWFTILDELHIENCGKLLWVKKSIEGDDTFTGVKHLKLVNMKYPRSYLKMIETVRKNVEKLTMINVTFEDEEIN